MKCLIHVFFIYFEVLEGGGPITKTRVQDFTCQAIFEGENILALDV